MNESVKDSQKPHGSFEEILKLANLGAEQFFMKTENTKQGCLSSSELWSSKEFGIFSSKWEATVKITLGEKERRNIY